MRIALFHPWIYLKSGLERSILELSGRSRHDWVIYTTHLGIDTYPELRNRNIVELDKVSVKRSYSHVAHAVITVLKQKIDLNPFDSLVISSEGVGDFFVFRNHNKPTVCFCHTPLKVIHDPYSRARYLENKPSDRLKFSIFSNIFKFIDKLAWQYYDSVVCNSEETRTRVLRAGLAKSDKIEVIHPGLDTRKIRPSEIYGNFFLIPGRVMWQKNIELGIEAFQIYQNEFHGDKDLIVAGMVDEKSKEYFEKLQEISGDNPHIRFFINPSDEELFSLYQNSYAVLFTALNEDWGMVPLEAMGFQKPVISVNRGGPLESIIHEQTGYLINPDPHTFASAMNELSGNIERVREMGVHGRQHVAKFDWSIFVDKFDEVLEQTVHKGNQ